MSYRCSRQNPCKHFSVEYDVFIAIGDTHVASRWVCKLRDDERCVPNCKYYEPKGRDAS